MYGADYAWILQEELGSSWWLKENDNCTVKQLQTVVEHVIIVSSYNHIVGNAQSFSGLVKLTGHFSCIYNFYFPFDIC